MSSKLKKVITIVLTILVLGGIAVASLVVIPRLTETRRTVAPTAPESEPEASNNEWHGGQECRVEFDLATTEITPTPTPTGEITPTPTSTITPTPTGGTTPTPTSTITPTPTQIVSCNKTCSSNSDCTDGLVCDGNSCRNSACTGESDCSCNPTPTPTPTRVTGSTPAPTSLPDAGIGLPTIGVLGGGVVMILLGILLAL